jgi:succinoglycan biosynthesis protein ExoV
VKLYYWNGRRNFGDELNLFLLPRLAPDLLDEDDSCLFLGIGTIMNQRVPPEPLKVVFSSGTGYGTSPLVDDRWHFYCVRGPLTQRALGIAEDTVATDAGILVRDYFKRRNNGTQDFGFMPHWSNDRRPLMRSVRSEDVLPISPMRSPEEVIGDISKVRILITESLHGAIVADSLRIPWIPIKLSENVLEFKWRDWCSTVGIEYQPWSFSAAIPARGLLGRWQARPFASELRACCRAGKPVLSREGVVSGLCDVLKERLLRLRRDWQY